MPNTGLKRLLLSPILGAVAGALVVMLLAKSQPDHSATQSRRAEASSGAPPARGPASYAHAVARAAPSVVNIFASKITTERQSLAFKDPLLQHYFGNMLPEQTRERMQTSLGSGVVVGEDGYVLTNLHVLKGADGIRVELADGSDVRVSFVGSDPETDLAILKMAMGGTPAIPVADSNALEVGDVALAIGNPFGVGQTVTMGIISATGRSHLGISAFENFIQTDAAINPGNSGGALINARGELIGINNVIYSQSGGSHGIGFAIPANLAMNVLDQIVDRGRVVRGWIGIAGRDVTSDVQESFALHTDSGVMVQGVIGQGPGDRAGLRPGDVITGIDNRSLGSTRDLLDIVANSGPGKELTIAGWRGSEHFEVTAVTEERPAPSH
jgi:serine protease DegS